MRWKEFYFELCLGLTPITCHPIHIPNVLVLYCIQNDIGGVCTPHGGVFARSRNR